MAHVIPSWQKELQFSLGEEAALSPVIGSISSTLSTRSESFEGHLAQVDPMVGITLHDISGICRAATSSISRILQVPLGRIRGSSLGEICSLADPCLIEPTLLSDVARIGCGVTTLRPHIPGHEPTTLKLVAVIVKIDDKEAIQVMWAPEEERGHELTKSQLMNVFENSLRLPREPEAAARTASRALAHFLDVDAAAVLRFDSDVDQFEIIAMTPEQPGFPRRGSLSKGVFADPGDQVQHISGILRDQFPNCAFVGKGAFRSIHFHTITGPLGTPLGAVCLLGRAATPPQDGAAAMLRLVAERLGILQSQTMLEEEARRTHLLQGLDDLTGAHAHDLRNYLTCIAGAAYQLGNRDTPATSVPGALNNIQESTQAALQLVDAMVESTRQASKDRGPIDLPAVLAKCVQLIQPCARSVSFEITEQGALPKALADENQITQVVLNLLRNAVEAMGGNGNIKIMLDEPSFRASNAPSIRFRIRDDGPGMPAEFRRRAFKPYATSSKKRGVGLGLAIAASLIREHNGRIEFENKNRAGTTVSVTLPATSIRENTVN